MHKKIWTSFLLCGLMAAGTTYAADNGRKPIKVYLMAGQSNVEGHNYFGQVCLDRYPGVDRPRDDVWCIFAKKISGPEAYRIGLVHDVWPLAQLKDRALQLALELAAMPAQAVRSMLNVSAYSFSANPTPNVASE